MGILTVYECDEPGCTRRFAAGENALGWTSIPEVYVIGEKLPQRHIVLCPVHRPTWAGDPTT